MCEPSDMTFTARRASKSAEACVVASDDDRETRAEICEECEYCVNDLPLTCKLLTRQKQIGPLPCPHVLRSLIADPGAVCPSPDAAWSRRWSAAAIAVGVSATAQTAAAAIDTAPKPSSRREHPRYRRRGFNERIIYVHPARSVAGP